MNQQPIRIREYWGITERLMAITVIASALFVPLSAHAETVVGNGSNAVTGNSSENINTLNVVNTNTGNVANTATVSNSFTVHTNSGGNTISGNTVVGPVNTGNNTVNTAVQTEANNGSQSVGGTHSTVNISENGNNQLTGGNSINRNDTNVVLVNATNRTNSATITNSASVVMNSGNNHLLGNTQAGGLMTGNNTVNLAFLTHANNALPGGTPTTAPVGGAAGTPTTSTTTTASSAGTPITTVALAAPATVKAAETKLAVGGGFFPAGMSLAYLASLYALLFLVSLGLVFNPEIRTLALSRLDYMWAI